MKIIYASRTGNVKKFVAKLGVEATQIAKGDEVANEDFLFITYTDGKGDIPAAVGKFLDANKAHFKAVAVSGNSAKHPDTFCGAAEKIADKYGVPVIVKFETEGDDAAVAAVKAAL